MFYSKSANSFYVKEIHGNKMPIDCVEISKEKHEELLAGQSLGKIIKADENGNPVLREPDPLSKEDFDAIADLNRKDAYMKEADPLFFKYQRDEATKEEWLDKVNEIKNRFPNYSEIEE
jgi:hypothetical protein